MTQQHTDINALEAVTHEPPFSMVNALKVIQAPTNPQWVSKKPQKKGPDLSYVSGDVVIRMLNKAFNYRWSFQVLETRMVESAKDKYGNEPGPVVQSLGRLTVPGLGVREQWGSQTIVGGAEVQSHAFKGASTDAMKKCASMFGIALDIYGQQGLRELRLTPEDLLTDDKEVLNKYKDKLEKELEVKEEEIVEHPPAEPQPEELTEDDDATPSSPNAPETTPEPVSVQPKEPQSAPAPVAPATPQAKQSKPVAGGWTKEDIQGMKDLKARLNLTNNEGLNPYVQEFFNDPTVDYGMIRPENAKDFLHFMSQK